MSDITAPADVAAAREHSPGRVYPLHRVTYVCPPCHGMCQQGRNCPGHQAAEACTDIGADMETPTAASVRLGLLLVVVVSVLSYGLLA
jgi:hypothetical protein